jgi:hypothetical protein
VVVEVDVVMDRAMAVGLSRLTKGEVSREGKAIVDREAENTAPGRRRGRRRTSRDVAVAVAVDVAADPAESTDKVPGHGMSLLSFCCRSAKARRN